MIILWWICTCILAFWLLALLLGRIPEQAIGLLSTAAATNFKDRKNEDFRLTGQSWKGGMSSVVRTNSIESSYQYDNLNSILENVNRAYILLDTDFKVLTFNKLGAHFTKTYLGVDIEKDMYSIIYFPSERQEILKQMLINALNGIPANYEVSYPQPGGVTWFEVHIHGTTNTMGNTIGVVMALNDVTERKTMMMEREKMTAELLQQNKNLEQFAYMVSHNLRAPVANIMGLCEELESGDFPEEIRTEFLKGVLLSSKRLDQVIIDMNEVLQLKRDPNKMKEDVDLALVVDEVCSLGGLCEKAAITCDFSEIGNISSVKTYLFSIFYNLLTNSIKYKQTGLDSVISIKSKLYPDHVELIFKDNGQGIDEKYHSNVFGMYKRFHNVTEGKGLGLFMTKTQVEALGGSIVFNTEVNEGTEFKIEWPL